MLPDFQNEETEGSKVADKIDTLYPFVYTALHSAVQVIMPEVLSSWHPSYQSEQYRAAGFRNLPTRSESRKCIPQDVGQSFANEFMEEIRTYDWGKNAYWFLQIRGAKDDTRHQGPLTDTVIDRVLENVIRPRSSIYLDVGRELHLPDGWACMPARGVNLHPRLAQILWGIDEDDEWTYDSYEVDPWAGLVDIAGFRANYASNPMTSNLISYVQVYSTDKFATYNSSSATNYKAVRVHPQQILNMRSPEEVPANIMKVYQVTAENQIAQTLTVTRMEARVPLPFAKDVYNPIISPRKLKKCLHAIPVGVIWWASCCHTYFVCGYSQES